MNNNGSIILTEDPNTGAALAWLRDILASAVEVAWLPVWLKKGTIRLIQRVPEQLLATWASVFNVNYLYGFRAYPDLPEYLRSGIGEEVVCRYLEAQRAVSTAKSLRQVVKVVVKLLRDRKIPADGQMVERTVAGLALGSCTPLSEEFIDNSSRVLQESPFPDYLLNKYGQALERGDGSKLENIDHALKASSYGNWVMSRLREVRKWLLGGRELNVQWQIEHLADNGGIYHILLKGGKNSED